MFEKLKNSGGFSGLTYLVLFFRALLFVSFSILSIFQLSASPLISEPKFFQLSTAQGLSQDTVNDLLIDSGGFLWVATQSGLNRFDGYRVEHFDGHEMQLADIEIDIIFEDKEQNIWVGTGRSGLFKIETKTGETTLIDDFVDGQSTWSDSVTSINQLPNSQIIVSTERSVYIVSPDLGKASLLYQLPKHKQVVKYKINGALFLEDKLLLARSDGLFDVDLISGTERQIKLQDKLSEESISKLFLASDNKIWVGSEIGLFCLTLDQSNQFNLVDHALSLPILEIYETSYGSLYIGSTEGLFSYDPSSAQLQHFFNPSDSRYYLSSDDVTAVDMDSKGNLWIGSSFDGALYWSTQSVKFENVRQNKDDSIQLSSNSVKSFAQFNGDGLWIGTSNGLNYYDLNEHELLGHWFTKDIVGAKRARIRDIETFGDNTLLLNTDGGLWFFDTRTHTFSPAKSANPEVAQLLNSRLNSLAKDGQGRYWFSNQQSFYQYNAQTGVVSEVETLNKQIDASASYGFLGVSHLFKDLLWIAERERLWAYNSQTDTLQSVHKLERASMGQPVYPESVIEDNQGTLWIAYPGAGLVGVDSTIYTPKYGFDKQDLLPSNMIYGIHQDKAGSIWMSSHAGLLKFDPAGPYLQQYGISQGLDGKEFNGLSHLVLQDGRLVYGSQKGLSIFDPLAFDTHQGKPPEVKITSIKLSSNSLKMPLVNLDKRVVSLDHKDAGLTIEFSTLSFEHQNTTQYQYRLDGADSYIYPATTDSQVTFPKLDPGEYVFSAIAFDPMTGVKSPPASVHIFVKYSPWLSPAAYAIYIFIFVSLVLFWWYRRDLQNKQVMSAHAEAMQSKNRLTLALSASNSNVWEWRVDTNEFYAPRISEELGYDSDDNLMSFDAHIDLIHIDDKALFESNWQAFINKDSRGLDVTYRLRSKQGEWLWYRDVGNEVVDDSSLKRVVAGTYSNVTETVADREKVRLFGEAFKHTRDWVVIFNTHLVPVAVNTAFCEAFGIDENGDLKSQLNRLFKLNAEYPPRFWKKLSQLNVTGHWKGEEMLIMDDEKVSNVLINMTSIASMRAHGEIDYYLMIMSDISEQKEAENELRRLANFDGLTNLPNRTLLLDRIKHGIDHAFRHKSKMGIFFIDLDRFKQVNDSLGHKAGDELLKVVAQRLTNLLRKDDTVARLGGDEFVVMVEEVKHPDRLSILAQQLIDVLEAPIQLGNQTVSVSSSVGIALYPGDAETPEELLRNADLAMYHAKEQGHSDFQYFTQLMNQKAQERLLMENRLKKAHQSKSFINYYQPIVNTKSGLVVGFELLMRWPDANGMIPPDQFIPVAEELGLIENMTWDALERAMPVLSAWQTNNREVYLSVNLSARHFERQISIDHILLLLEQYSLPVSSLRFEITESALMRDYERALHYMASMRERGFTIALDDFGTGYSSLKYLKEFPIQVLKVDKSFVDDIGKNKSNEALVLTTLRMAESLGMYCVAEGIEQQVQIDFFKQYGCNHLQGYFYSKPVPEDQTAALIAKSWLL